MQPFLRGFLLITVLGFGLIYGLQQLEQGNLALDASSLNPSALRDLGSLDLAAIPTTIRSAPDTVRSALQDEQLTATQQSFQDTAATLSARSQEVGKHAQAILGTSIVQPVDDTGQDQRGQNGNTSAGKNTNDESNGVGGASDSAAMDSAAVTSSQQPIHERAIEYAQYQYCKRVVEAWEKEN